MYDAKSMQKLVLKMFEKKEVLNENELTFAVIANKEQTKVVAVVVADEEATGFFKGIEILKVNPRLGLRVEKNEEHQGLDVYLSIDFDKYVYETKLDAKFKKYQTAVLEGLKACEKVGIAVVDKNKKMVRPISVTWEMDSLVKTVDRSEESEQ